MKNIKCPFCGKKPETHYYDEEEGHDEFWITGCPDCDLFSGITAASKEISQRDWNTLIAKFPPIMRVQERDIIEYEETCDGDILNGRVTLRTVSSRGETMLQVVIIDEDGNDYLDFNGKPEIDTICSFQIRKWPWELEQKGGEEQ